MKKLMLTLGLFASMAAFALTDAEKQGMLNRNMGVTASQVGLGDLVMGGSGSVYLGLAGGTMSGKLRITDTGNSVTHNSNALAVDGGISAEGNLWAGAVGSGTGGKIRLKRDTGVEGWRAGLPGSAGATDYVIRDTVGGNDIIAITTSKQVQLGAAGTRIAFEQDGGNTSIQTVVLSGVSTLIANTSLTANSYPFPVGVGATNVAPWLIGITAGVGYSLGATGAGNAKVVIFEGL